MWEEKNTSVELKGDALTLRAEKRQEEKPVDKGWYRVERSYGSFQRVLVVPEDADPDGVKARYKKGVLTVAPAQEQGGQVPVGREDRYRVERGSAFSVSRLGESGPGREVRGFFRGPCLTQ